MTLDWDFFYDSWLIDKVPDYLEVVIEEHPSGLIINPPELVCYFGANPIYLYGLGKLQHEVIMSPDGIVIYPEFLERPGFEFVEKNSMRVVFDEEYDFHGNWVLDKHIGNVDAKRYLESIFYNIFGTSTDYAGIRMPSSSLRRLNQDDYRLQEQDPSRFRMYEDVGHMIGDGCVFYCSMSANKTSGLLKEEINNIEFPMTAPGAVIQVPGIFGLVVLTRYSYAKLPSYAIDGLTDDKFQIFFSINKDFRYGTVLDFGSTEYSSGNNYGFRIDILPNNINIIANDGSLNRFSFVCSFDFGVPNKILIQRDGEKFALSINGILVEVKEIMGIGNIAFEVNTESYIAKIANGGRSGAGEMEELAIFSTPMSSDYMDIYSYDALPFLYRGGGSAVVFDNIPLSLSYDLTYVNPVELFISNFFGGDVDKIYLINNVQNIISQSIAKSSTAKSSNFTYNTVVVPNGYKIHQVTTNNMVDGIDYVVGTKMPVITKLTSDTHIPIKIRIKFQIPEWWNKKNTYNIRLMLRSVNKLLKYEYKKFKTGEFV